MEHQQDAAIENEYREENKTKTKGGGPALCPHIEQLFQSATQGQMKERRLLRKASIIAATKEEGLFHHIGELQMERLKTTPELAWMYIEWLEEDLLNQLLFNIDVNEAIHRNDRKTEIYACTNGLCDGLYIISWVARIFQQLV